MNEQKPMETRQNTLSDDPPPELRRQYLKAVKADKAERERLAAAGVPSWRMAAEMAGNPHRLDMAAFSALRCGAKTRKGEPCKRRDIYANSRCINHGGLSTGPKTKEGMLRAWSNLPCFRELKVSRSP